MTSGLPAAGMPPPEKGPNAQADRCFSSFSWIFLGKFVHFFRQFLSQIPSLVRYISRQNFLDGPRTRRAPKAAGPAGEGAFAPSEVSP